MRVQRRRAVARAGDGPAGPGRSHQAPLHQSSAPDTERTDSRRLTFAAKRTLDVVLSAVGLVALLPLAVCAAVAVALEDGPPVFYAATRGGRDGQSFRMYKFRTMRRNAAATGSAITVANDPRITHVGQILRATRFDELPQLWNVLRGEMSLVGPRPEAPAYVALYTPEQRIVLRVRPGVTGPAQIRFADEARLLRPGYAHEDYVAIVLPAKLAMDAQYVRTLSFWHDLRLLGRTLGALLGRATQHRGQPLTQD